MKEKFSKISQNWKSQITNTVNHLALMNRPMSISLLFYSFYQRSFFSSLCALEDPGCRSPRKGCPYLELFWSVFMGVSLYSVQMQENTDQITDSNTDTFHAAAAERNYSRRGHLFSTHKTFSEKLIFLTPWYGHVRVRIKG